MLPTKADFLRCLREKDILTEYIMTRVPSYTCGVPPKLPPPTDGEGTLEMYSAISYAEQLIKTKDIPFVASEIKPSLVPKK
jgi:hypothetical protein